MIERCRLLDAEAQALKSTLMTRELGLDCLQHGPHGFYEWRCKHCLRQYRIRIAGEKTAVRWLRRRRAMIAAERAEIP